MSSQAPWILEPLHVYIIGNPGIDGVFKNPKHYKGFEVLTADGALY